MKHYPRSFEQTLQQRLKEKPGFIQVVLGPRQVGKTSGVLHTLKQSFSSKQYDYYSCEEDIVHSDWFLRRVQDAESNKKKIIIFDEIQKIENWSELVKLAWDRQKREGKLIHWVLLGSSSLQLSIGLGDSLAGRFEIIPVHHWQYEESKRAFQLSFEQYLMMGGYPGSYSLKANPQRFRTYVIDSIFEAVISRDILRFVTIKKPALFRQTFLLACQYPAREVSYNKLLGQLQDAGNVDQIKHYLDLFQKTFLLKTIYKYSSTMLRSSSPKILPSAPVFTSIFQQGIPTPELKGQIFEAIVGNRLCENFSTVYYWREGNFEVDFVVDLGSAVVAVEVKSTTRPSKSVDFFRKKFPKAKVCFIDFKNYLDFEKNPLAFLQKHAL